MKTEREYFDLSRRNTFGMKVSCRLYLEITSEEDLLSIDFASLPSPLLVMGGGSNLLFTGDFPGTVLHVSIEGMECQEEADGSVRVTAGAGTVFDDLCAWACRKGLWGPENLSLIPGEVGASAVQNIGAYGVEAGDIIDSIRAYDIASGRFVTIGVADCAYGYRTSNFKTIWKGRYIITEVTFRFSSVPTPRLDYGGVRKALEEAFPGSTGEGYPLTPGMVRDTVISIRERKLPDPRVTGSAGSFFCNPVIGREHFERIVSETRKEKGEDYNVPHYELGDRIKVPAAWMIEQCGFKGKMEGGAQVYPGQPLVIVNASGDATPGDVLSLESRIIGAVKERYGVELHPEVEHVPTNSGEST